MSDSTNTVHTVVSRTGFFALSEMSPMSSKAHAQSVGGAAEKSSRAGGAFVIHDEVFDVAIDADLDALGILAAHVDHRAGVGKEVAGAARMAADLGNLGVAEGDLVSAVTGADDVGDIFALDAGDLQRFDEASFRGPGDVGAGVGQGSGDDLELVVEDNPFSLSRANVNACGVNHAAPPASAPARTIFLCSKDSKNASMRFLSWASEK